MIFFIYQFLDNIDTRTVLDIIRELITHTNIYLRDRKPLNLILLNDIAQFISRIFSIFGVINVDKSIGFRSVKSGESVGNVSKIITINNIF